MWWRDLIVSFSIVQFSYVKNAEKKKISEKVSDGRNPYRWGNFNKGCILHYNRAYLRAKWKLLQSNQVKRTPQEPINEFIIQ